MSRRRIAIYIGIALVAAFVLFKIGEKIFIMIKMKGRHGMPPSPVEIATAEQQQWQDQIHSTGTISAIQGVTIAPQVSGQITKIYFTSGTDVKKGDPLFQIFPDILEAQLASDKAALSLAQVNYDRATVLYQKKVASKEQLDQYTTELQQAQANLAQTQAQLVQHNIVAPFSGRIGLKTVDVGNFVNVGQNLVSLQQMNPMRVDFYVPDRYIGTLNMGDKVEVKPSSASDNTVYVGNVYAFNSAVDPDTRSFSMWAQIPNPDENLIPGTYVDITLYVGKPHPVIAIPQTAALFSPQGEYVYTLVDKDGTKTVAKTEVTVGLRENNLIEVTSGLNAGDTVVTAGQVKLYDGAQVVIAPTSTYAAENPPAINYVTFPKGQPLSPDISPDASNNSSATHSTGINTNSNLNTTGTSAATGSNGNMTNAGSSQNTAATGAPAATTTTPAASTGGTQPAGSKSNSAATPITNTAPNPIQQKPSSSGSSN